MVKLVETKLEGKVEAQLEEEQWWWLVVGGKMLQLVALEMLVVMVVENLVGKEGAELVVMEKMAEERVKWKEEGLQALPEEVKEVEQKGQRGMKEQGNQVFDWAGKNWEVMEGWRNWLCLG